VVGAVCSSTLRDGIWLSVISAAMIAILWWSISTPDRTYRFLLRQAGKKKVALEIVKLPEEPKDRRRLALLWVLPGTIIASVGLFGGIAKIVNGLTC